MYPRLVLKAVEEEERAKPLPVAPFEAPRVIDGWQLGLEDPSTWPLSATLTISDMHSRVAKHGGTFWYHDRTLSVR